MARPVCLQVCSSQQLLCLQICFSQLSRHALFAGVADEPGEGRVAWAKIVLTISSTCGLLTKHGASCYTPSLVNIIFVRRSGISTTRRGGSRTIRKTCRSSWTRALSSNTSPTGPRNPKPKTRDPKPETRNPKPETRNPKPLKNRQPKSETRNLKP